MSTHVLLNLINELGKSDARLADILSGFRNEFNTRAQMFDSIYHNIMPLRLLWNQRNVVMDVIHYTKICKPLGVYRF